MKVSQMKLQSYTVNSNRDGKKRLTLNFSNGAVIAQVIKGDIENADMNEWLNENLPQELTAAKTEKGWSFSEGPQYGQVDHNLFTRPGQFGSYAGFTEPYTYHKYDFAPVPVSDAGKIQTASAQAFIDDEHSLVIKLADGRGVRVLNTKVVNGKPMIDITLLENNSQLLAAVGLTTDDVLNNTGEVKEATVGVVTKLNNKKDKAYIEITQFDQA